jgi:hypothetical protein
MTPYVQVRRDITNRVSLSGHLAKEYDAIFSYVLMKLEEGYYPDKNQSFFASSVRIDVDTAGYVYVRCRPHIDGVLHQTYIDGIEFFAQPGPIDISPPTTYVLTQYPVAYHFPEITAFSLSCTHERGLVRLAGSITTGAFGDQFHVVAKLPIQCHGDAYLEVRTDVYLVTVKISSGSIWLTSPSGTHLDPAVSISMDGLSYHAAPLTAPMVNSWASYGTYYWPRSTLVNNRVYLNGAVKGGDPAGPANQIMGTLQSGYRPKNDQKVTTLALGINATRTMAIPGAEGVYPVRLVISSTTGEVKLKRSGYDPPTFKYIFLDGISFDVGMN